MKLFDVYPLYEVCPVKAKDVHVYDEAGTEYLDLYGGHAVILFQCGRKPATATIGR
jgi:acetylornithine/N-succinyldiaminopimelate aminotransferase